jgi:hypothetical protein
LSNNTVVLRPLAVFFFVFAFASIRLWTTLDIGAARARPDLRRQIFPSAIQSTFRKTLPQAKRCSRAIGNRSRLFSISCTSQQQENLL